MYVLNETAMRESPRKIHEVTMMASGKPSGVISLAEGSMALGAADMVDPGQIPTASTQDDKKFDGRGATLHLILDREVFGGQVGLP
jgi:hypothetical protein